MKGPGEKRSPINAFVFLLLLTNLIFGCKLPEWDTNQEPWGYINLPISKSEYNIGAPIAFE